MRIYAQTPIISCKNNLRQTSAPSYKEMPKDAIVFSSNKTMPILRRIKSESLPLFQHIKLQTAEKLYRASSQYKPSGEEYNGNVYKTFVLNRKTGEPVEMLVKPQRVERYAEEYYILDPNNKLKPQNVVVIPNLIYPGTNINIPYEDTMGMSVAGIRHFSFDTFGKEILSGEMSSYEKGQYSGLGFIEHQLTIERMLMKNYSKLNISALPSAYKFHKDCGFKVLKDSITIDAAEFNSKVDEYAQRLNLDKDAVKEMLVYTKKINGQYRLYKNLSFENIINYFRNNNIPIDDEYFSVDMRLTKEALREWKKIIERRPIIIGNHVENIYVREGNK